VAIVDLDVHQGDGTATILDDSPGTLTISVHCKDNFPFRKATSDHDLPLDSGGGDLQYLEKVGEAMEIVESYKPDLVLFQAGVDALEKDGLGKLKVTREGMKARNRMVLSVIVEKAVPCVIFMGGGYSKPIKHTVDAFYDLFIDGAIANIYMQAMDSGV
jgi:acetoin utilization deacetylase AcuC-like enzyme